MAEVGVEAKVFDFQNPRFGGGGGSTTFGELPKMPAEAIGAVAAKIEMTCKNFMVSAKLYQETLEKNPQIVRKEGLVTFCHQNKPICHISLGKQETSD